MSNTASSNTLAELSESVARLVARAASAVVSIQTHRSRSSGFLWRPGLIVTADEALAEDHKILVVLSGGKSVPAILLGRDPTTDIALLRIDDAELKPNALDASAVTTGSVAFALGSRDGALLTSMGIVAFVGEAWRSLRGGDIDARIELDLRLRREGEGGLAIDAGGRVFGMTVFGPRRRVLVIPSATIERIAAKLETHGRIARGYLGLGLQRVRLAGEERMGAMVMGVEEGGPGDAAGVRQGDVIVAWDGQPLRGVPSLMRRLGPDSIDSIVTLSLKRAGAPMDVSLTIGERPPA